MKNVFAALAVASLALGGCGGAPGGWEVQSSFTNDQGNANRYVRAATDVDPNTFMESSRKACEGEASCFVYVWLGDAPMPSAWPMLPSEEKSYAFRYQLKRHAGVERGFWDCSKFKRATEEECIIR